MKSYKLILILLSFLIVPTIVALILSQWLPDEELGKTEVGAMYPDSKLTKGELSKDWTIQDICKNGTGKYRNVSESLKKEVAKRYGIKYPQPTGTLEIDHWYSLGIGGSNGINNLWPMSADQFHWKDSVEAYLNRQICSGKMKQSEAIKITDNWVGFYEKNLKNKLGSENDYCEEGCE